LSGFLGFVALFVGDILLIGVDPPLGNQLNHQSPQLAWTAALTAYAMVTVVIYLILARRSRS
jgi:hypothetical protein